MSQFKRHSFAGYDANSSLQNMVLLARTRRNISNMKNQNPILIKNALRNHQQTIKEYSDEFTTFMLDAISSYNIPQYIHPLFNIDHCRRLSIFNYAMHSHMKLNLCTPALFLTFNILNRYISNFEVNAQEHQLVALTALWIASKYWDIKYRTVTLHSLSSVCGGIYTRKQFKDMEFHLLKSLNWTICDGITMDSLIDTKLFEELESLNKENQVNNASSSSIANLNVNEIKLGTVMLCELAFFDERLTFDNDYCSIVEAAISIVISSLKFQYYNEWQNLETLHNHPNLTSVAYSLLNVITSYELLAPSFKSKYIFNTVAGQPITPANKLLVIMLNYNTRIQLESFSPLQNYELTEGSSESEFSSTRSNSSLFDHLSYSTSPVCFPTRSKSGRSSVSSLPEGTNFESPLEPKVWSLLSLRTSKLRQAFVPLTPSTPTLFNLHNSRKSFLRHNFNRRNSNELPKYGRKRLSVTSIEFSKKGTESKRAYL
ncbi:hypothetical protein KAFR_0K00490 [Kazachstania africana CBS 2517]|uniref:Cyclin-like domain-containing protein n=1 Tax=Kazachstania africana (strain ATCC 22294 / BCRC 22015 / CBS 2517 / CECT 1963 / NBRC 1671 / NRRL Y-8276) TaxID=1071382 RepID=H2B1A4_KAZAF|nr:hypothetical protein KAFR_0K00490 [Kazachstania africana CBS 2517]CCF60404.1 hypothetical protein KAFR_0K00490 [Kazachstania africana CBS 2517]